MDIICNYVKICESINYDDQNVKDAIKAVDILMKRFVKAMGEDYPEFVVEDLRLCGSMAEKTRIKDSWIFLEFDYVAVMKTWPGHGELQPQPTPYCSASSKIIFNVKDKDTTKTDFLTIDIADIFVANFRRCIEHRCRQYFCPQTLNYDRMFSNYQHVLEPVCQFCSVYIGNGRLNLIRESRKPDSVNWRHSTIAFNWTVTNKFFRRRHLNILEIYVDFNPVLTFGQCVKLNSKRLALIPKRVSMCRMYGIICENYSKITTKDHVRGHDFNLDWRITTYEDELNLICRASYSHKVAFMTLKFLMKSLFFGDPNIFGRDISRSKQHLTPYHIKNTFMLHLQKCQYKCSYKAGECLKLMLEKLLECHTSFKLPHFRLKYNMGCGIYCRYTQPLNHQIIAIILRTTIDLLSEPKLHNYFEDIIQDLDTLMLICDIYNTEMSLSLQKSSLSLEKRPLLVCESCSESDMVRLLSFQLSEFLSIRHKKSANDTMKHYVLKFCKKISVRRFVEHFGDEEFMEAYEQMTGETNKERVSAKLYHSD